MKRIIIIQLFIFINANLFSQTETKPYVEEVCQKFDYQEYQQIFSDIDASSLSTGFLSNKCIQLISFADYNGSDSAKTITYYKWQQLYDQVEVSQVGHRYRFPCFDSIYYEYSKKSNAIVQYDDKDAINNVKENIKNENFIPISVIDINYDEVKKDAFDKNLLTVFEQKIIETSNKTESPYTINNLYAASALKNTIYQGNNVNFLFDSDFYFTNKNESIVQYNVDFDDGVGLRDMNWGQTLNVSYTSTGTKTIKLIKTNKNRTEEEQFITTFSISVMALTTPSPTFTIPLNIAIPSNYPHGGVNVRGTGYVYTSDGSQNIRNPIIICEGFDPENTRGWNELYCILNKQNFIECMKSNGYDFIVLDFADGGAYIERNAYLLKGLIENVNNRKITQNKLVVIGASMGGLVSRYALAYMEKNRLPHDTRLFISFDAPHQGANIPLGAQYWLKFFADMNGTVQSKYNNILCSTAARQMLVYHSEYSPNPSDNPYRISFLQNLSSVGYPTKLRKIAIANGSGNAYGQRKNDGSILNPTDQIISWYYRNFWTVDIDGNSWTVPNGIPKTTIFYGRIALSWIAHIWQWNFKDGSLTVTFEGSSPYDTAPGGTRNTAQEIAENDTDGYGTISTNANNHCFIPTISALDINRNLLYNISADLDILSKTPFDAIYYPINTNEEHVYISAACATWVKNEIVPQNVVLDGSEGWNTGDVRAGNRITLKPGFSTVSGKTFRAYISPLQPCTNPSLLSVSISDDDYSDNNQQGFLSSLTIDNDTEALVSAFPNPSTGKFCIQVKNAENIDHLEVKNIQGITIYKNNNNLNNETFIDITNQPDGIYIVMVLINGKIQTTKIIKN